MKTITRERLRDWLQQDKAPTVVEVLDRKYFRKEHLPGAINVPVGDDFDKRIREAVPDRSLPVVVYCADLACRASPTAAKAMDELGYNEVYDYEAGKEDWKQAGLPLEKAA